MGRLPSLLLFLSFSAFGAEPLPLAKPETVGMSAEHLGRIGDWGVLLAQVSGVPGLSLREKFAGLVYGAIVD